MGTQQRKDFGTHFYTSNAPEAAGLRVNPNWVFEAAVLGLLPLAAICPAGTVALLRVYSRSMGGVPSHRFTTDPGEMQLMVLQGWQQEGDCGMAGCVPL